MSKEIIIGIVALLGAIAMSTGLLIWSCSSIERISKEGYRTARAIIKERHRE